MFIGICPPWEYKTVAGHAELLRQRHLSLITDLLLGRYSAEVEARDSRSVHETLFTDLTPPDRPYYAGHYRGEPFVCLQHYGVRVPSDPLVGAPAAWVLPLMSSLGARITEAVQILDGVVANDAIDVRTKLYQMVAVAAAVFQEILTIHPYANGNGHAARFLVWLLLGRYQRWPKKWTIDPQPTHPQYAQAIGLHRRGDRTLLERLILESLLP